MSYDQLKIIPECCEPVGEHEWKVKAAINRLKNFEPKDGYYVAFSGGKDSQCVYHLCKMAGVKFDAHYNVTSVDPPELVNFIRNNYPDVIWEYPRDADGKVITMWNLIPMKLTPPTRINRYCCKSLKERSGQGRIVVTGVRWAESVKRAKTHGVVGFQGRPKATQKIAEELDADYKINQYGNVILNDDNDEARRMVEHCYRTHKTMVNPIVDWSEQDVWQFLNENYIEHCILYDQGYKRLGCIGCPMNTNTTLELERYPAYKRNYLKAFERMLQERKAKNYSTSWDTAEDVMRWWLQDENTAKELKNDIGYDPTNSRTL